MLLLHLLKFNCIFAIFVAFITFKDLLFVSYLGIEFIVQYQFLILNINSQCFWGFFGVFFGRTAP